VRENSPYLEEDDIVQFRQLTYECVVENNLWILNTPPIPTKMFPGASVSQPRWTGMILNARITGIQRKEELVSVRILGLDSERLLIEMSRSRGQKLSCKFNIQFPVMKERYLAMQQVLPVIQWALGENVCNSKYANGSTTPNGHLNPPWTHGSYAVSHRNWILKMLCPIEVDCAVQARLNPGVFVRKFFDTELNWEQKKAAECVCSRDYGTLPFLISGPPGKFDRFSYRVRRMPMKSKV